MQKPPPHAIQHWQRLGPHQFAHLRAVAEGLGVSAAAKRYLAIEHGAEAITAHRLIVDMACALAKRLGDSRWRLIGLNLTDKAPNNRPPSITDWAQAEGLDAWSELELLDLYAERFGHADSEQQRRAARNNRLRERRLALLRELEGKAGVRPLASDPLTAWLPQPLAMAWQRVGTLTLGDLHARIARGGRWYTVQPGFGPIKAGRLAEVVRLLISHDLVERPGHRLVAIHDDLTRLSGSTGNNRAALPVGTTAGIEARDDRAAIHTWIAARAGSELTAKLYKREAERFLYWCVAERGKALSSATAEDCRAYMDFIGNVPQHWISRAKVTGFPSGVAAFRDQPKLSTQMTTLAMIHSLFDWLVRARYLASNPWVLVNRKLGDDARADEDLTSRAFTPEAWAALLDHLAKSPSNAATARLRWLCTFVEATGLRAAELLGATRKDFTHTPKGWLLRVMGKGRKNRTVPVPKVAMDATRRYFAARCLDFDSSNGGTPLVGSTTHPLEGVGYQSLQESFRRFVKRATRGLPLDVRSQAERGTAHWLRHTHATRALERGVPADVVQEGLGHGDARSTAKYTRAQIARRQQIIESAFKTNSSEDLSQSTR